MVTPTDDEVDDIYERIDDGFRTYLVDRPISRVRDKGSTKQDFHNHLQSDYSGQKFKGKNVYPGLRGLWSKGRFDDNINKTRLAVLEVNQLSSFVNEVSPSPEERASIKIPASKELLSMRPAERSKELIRVFNQLESMRTR